MEKKYHAHIYKASKEERERFNNNNNNLLTYSAPVTWEDAHRRITKENQSHGLHFKIMRIFTSIWKH